MPRSVLVAWVGRTDRKVAAGDPEADIGPLAQAVKAGAYDEILMLSDFPPDQSAPCIRWLGVWTAASTKMRPVKLSSPIDLGEIYQRAVGVLATIDRRQALHRGHLRCHPAGTGRLR